jgi:hypothetical protein
LISSTASFIPSRTWTPHGAKFPVREVRAPSLTDLPDAAAELAVEEAALAVVEAALPAGAAVVF